MRFVFVSTMGRYPWGGSEELWSRAALRLRMEGHHVAAWVSWHPQISGRVLELAEQGIEVFVQSPPFTRLPVRLWRQLQARLGQKQSSRELRWLLRQKPDLVCVSNGGIIDGLHVLEMCLENRIPYASVIQANAECMWPNDEEADRLIRVYQAARRAFFVSDENRFLFETQLGIELTNAQRINNPTNVRWEAAPPWPDDAAGWKLACIGRFEPPAKGQDLLLHVLSSPSWKARPVTLSLYGAGHMARGLRRLAVRLGLDDRVHLVGNASDIEAVWAENHLLVLASRYEGLPLVLVEAMLCSRPAVITETAGDRLMVEEGVTGFVAPAPTIRFVGLAMERAWERRADWREMGKAARQRVETLAPKDPVGRFCLCLKKCLENCE